MENVQFPRTLQYESNVCLNECTITPVRPQIQAQLFTHKLSEDGPNQLTAQLLSAQFKQQFKQLSSYFSCCELLFHPPIHPSLHICLSAYDVSESVSVISVVTDAFILHGAFMLPLFLPCFKKKVKSSPTLEAFHTHAAEKACPRTESLVLNVSTFMSKMY